MMDEHSISTPYPSFKSTNNMVHIDEKWYDMTRVKNSYYVLPGEPEPERTVSNTNSIGKTEAQRNCQNRDRGTIEVKSVKVTRHVCREYLINELISAIQDKWPDDDEGTTIFIQQDNAKPHVLPNDPGF
uniref:Transposase n=1 Tax=Hordeum vulgare subsp. vulgare TaxID=112509 RepID=A0A8I6YMJ1_HORVV